MSYTVAEERMQNYIDELEKENRLLRARNDRLEAEAKVVSVQEPVAWVEHEWSGSGLRHLHFERREQSVRDEVMNPIWTPLYTTPPVAKQQWVDLTDRQIESIFIDAGWSWGEKADMYVPAVREVLKLFKETNE